MYLNEVQVQLMRERMAEIDREARLAWLKPDRFAPRPARFGLIRRTLSATTRVLSRPLQAIGQVFVPCKNLGAEQVCGSRNPAVRSQTVNTTVKLGPL